MAKNKGGRPAGEKTRNSGQWTESRYNSFITSLLRSGTRRWGPIQDTKKEARVTRGFYECAICKEHVPTTLRQGAKRVQNVFVDHINPIVNPDTGFTSWDEYIERMFCEKENLQLVCQSCHEKKSSAERERSIERRKKEKETNGPE